MLLLGAYRIYPYICERLTKSRPAVSLCQGPSVSGPSSFLLFIVRPLHWAWRTIQNLFNPKNILLWQNQSHFSVSVPDRQSL